MPDATAKFHVMVMQELDDQLHGEERFRKAGLPVCYATDDRRRPLDSLYSDNLQKAASRQDFAVSPKGAPITTPFDREEARLLAAMAHVPLQTPEQYAQANDRHLAWVRQAAEQMPLGQMMRWRPEANED